MTGVLGTDLQAVVLTLMLASVSTVVLVVLATPLAWWLARTRSRLRAAIDAVVSLPLVLPPTVLGFYLLIALGPHSPLGRVWQGLFGGSLVFTFSGLVVGSVIYSLPFVVQPLRNGFQAVDDDLLRAADTLGASALDRFFSVAVPLSRPSFLTAAVLGFAHTVGEFGVVLMIGGNVPGRTQVASVLIFNYVERMEYGRAHWLAAGMVAFSFVVLLALYSLNRRVGHGLS